jgi:serine/threonine-protein kinase
MMADMRGSDLTGAVVEGRYKLVERLAEGAMGVVYRGVSIKLDRAIAIKIMHGSLPREMAAKQRFQREAKLMALLEHPHCVSVIDYGVHQGKPFVVMELVRGRSLHDLLVEQKRFEVMRAADIMRQALSGLAHAHEQGIIHRDIKPANMMITPKAPLGVHVRILDFGLARLRESSGSLTDGLAVGTPSYMAPEQCRGESLDTRVDVYACGIVLFEMLTSKKPFTASDPIETVKLQLNQPPPRMSDVAGGESFGELETVVARALAKAPADRFPSAIAMSDAIDAALAGRSSPEATAAFQGIVEPLGSSALIPVEPTVDVPITVESSVGQAAALAPRDEPVPSAATTVRRLEPDDRSALRRMLPVSRMRWVVLAALLVIGAGVYAMLTLTHEDVDEAPRAATPGDARSQLVQAPEDSPPDPTIVRRAAIDELISQGRVDAAIDAIAKARRKYPDSAALAYVAGKVFFARLWWADGIKAFRDAMRADPSLRDNPELIQLALHGFITTPETNAELAAFLAELGTAAHAALEETARTHPNRVIRARAAAQLRKTSLLR